MTSLIDGLCANAALFASGVACLDGARVAVLRISVSNWSTTADDVERSVAALRKAAS